MAKQKNPVRIHKLHRLETQAELWGFSLGMHGYFINGCVYNRQTGSIRMPGCRFQEGKRKVSLVKVGGMQVKYLRQRLERLLEEEDDG